MTFKEPGLKDRNVPFLAVFRTDAIIGSDRLVRDRHIPSFSARDGLEKVMIKTVGEMLEALRQAEAAKLDASDIRHAPTIGSMYEGLTRSLLERAVPASMDLRIVSGFLVDGRGGTSGQLDCMLVSGEGRAVPYVDGVYQWHVRDVLAVFEVKKNLFGGDLSDAHGQLLNVVNTYSSWVQNAHEATAVNVRASMRAYAECVGTVLPAPDDWETMDRAKHLIWHTISMDQLAPVRIVLGYGGYSMQWECRHQLF